jgi:GNAT superfamily N-acetyltransferase
MEVLTAAEDPTLVERTADFGATAWPEYNRHGVVTERYWGRLGTEFPRSQFALVEGDEVLVSAHSIPVPWDGTDAGLPAGIDGALEAGFALRERGEEPDALCALAVMVRPEARSRGLSRQAVEAMIGVAAVHGLSDLIAPVRPSHKERYPVTPIQEYVHWTDAEGLPFDPWMRVHARLGGNILRPEPRSLLIEGSVAEWEEWTGMAFPVSGEYWFPRGLALLDVDRDADRATYHEPNVWMRHEVPVAPRGDEA